MISKKIVCSLRKKRNERPYVGGVVFESTGKKGCVSNDLCRII